MLAYRIRPSACAATTLVVATILLSGAAPIASLNPPAAAAPQARSTDGARWPNGPSADPTYFPIGVWLQAPTNAAAYKAIGINLFIGLWEGPTDAQLGALDAAGMPVIADQNAVGLAHRDDPTLAGWLQQDEPDNAQPDGAGGYGPCVDPTEVIARYEAMRANDPSRPVLLNLGQGVAWDMDRPYIGRGSACASKWEQYPEYVKGADIVSFDIYPVTSPYDHIRDDLWRVGLGMDRLRAWTKGEKPIWSVIETTHIGSTAMPTPHQLRAEVWISLVHGATGLFYFAHEWQPTFREAGLLHYPEMRTAVAELNSEIRDLAPALNSSTVAGGIDVASSDPAVPVDTLVKQHGGWTYIFAVAMRDSATRATFTLPGVGPGARPGALSGARVEVIGENRTIPLDGRSFTDAFGGYDVHLYRVPVAVGLGLPWVGR